MITIIGLSKRWQRRTVIPMAPPPPLSPRSRLLLTDEVATVTTTTTTGSCSSQSRFLCNIMDVCCHQRCSGRRCCLLSSHRTCVSSSSSTTTVSPIRRHFSQCPWSLSSQHLLPTTRHTAITIKNRHNNNNNSSLSGSIRWLATAINEIQTSTTTDPSAVTPIPPRNPKAGKPASKKTAVATTGITNKTVAVPAAAVVRKKSGRIFFGFDNLPLPLYQLKKYYEVAHNIVDLQLRHEFITTNNNNDSKKSGGGGGEEESGWTAKFTCPVTGRVFRSGFFRSEWITTTTPTTTTPSTPNKKNKKKKKNDHGKASSSSSSSVMAAMDGGESSITTSTQQQLQQQLGFREVLSGADRAWEVSRGGHRQVLYPKKSAATHAVAARAMDTLRFEYDGTIEPRMCEEDPIYNSNNNTKTTRTTTQPPAPKQSKTNNKVVDGKEVSSDRAARPKSTRKRKNAEKSTAAAGSSMDVAAGQAVVVEGSARQLGSQNEAAMASTVEELECDDDEVEEEEDMGKEEEGEKGEVSSLKVETQEGESASNESKVLFRGSTTWELDSYYKQQLQDDRFSLDDLMQVEMVSQSGLNQVWTAQYKCPLSGRVFQSGSLRPEGRTPTQQDQESFELVENNKKRIFYRRKNTAIQAAAGRALDILRFEKDGTLEPRLCEEDPLDDGTRYTSDSPDTDDDGTRHPDDDDDTTMIKGDSDSNRISFEIDDDGGIGGGGGGSMMLMDLDEKLLDVPDEPVDAAIMGTAVTDFTSLTTTNIESFAWQEEEEEDETTIQTPLFVYQPQVPVENESPALRLLSSLAGSLSMSTSASKSSSSSSSSSSSWSPILPGGDNNHVGAGSTLVQSEDDRLRRVEREALTWLESVSKRTGTITLHGIELPHSIPSSALFIAKSLLASLAELNQSRILRSSDDNNNSGNSQTRLSHHTSPSSPEETASRILNMLLNADSISPDVDVYNLYLQCLEGPDPITRALKAERIVHIMKLKAEQKKKNTINNNNNKGANLPPPPEPNIGTYNTLLHIWAQVGGPNGRYSKLDESFEPNRDSFLAVLSSSSYVSSMEEKGGGNNNNNNVFDLNFAKQCIQRMTRLHQASSSAAGGGGTDESLKPDVQIFNAPMRWSGGLLWRESRPNTRRIAWDDHRAIYEKGFKPFTSTTNNPRVRNAEKLEEWIKYMVEEHGVQPNIETYEALIQAWVRTGTRQGLEKAETTLIRDIPSSIPIRLQTLHPIIAAWLHVKDKDSASKIMNWIDFLRSKDEATRDAVQTDLRFLCLEIATNMLQLSQLARNGIESAAAAKDGAEDPLELPRRCSLLFKKLAKQIDDAPVEEHSTLLPLLTSPAMLTLTAWGQCGVQLSNDVVACQAVLDAMVDVLDTYESVLRDVANKEAESMENNTEVSGMGLSEELRCAVFGAQDVFHCLAVQMHDTAVAFRRTAQNNSNNSNDADILQPHLLRMEKMCRRFEEFHEIGLLMGMERENQSKLVFADRYDYQFSSLTTGSSSSSSSSIETRSSFPWKNYQLLESMSHHGLSKSSSVDVVRLCFFLKNVIRNGGIRRGLVLDENFDGILRSILPRPVNHRVVVGPSSSSNRRRQPPPPLPLRDSSPSIRRRTDNVGRPPRASEMIPPMVGIHPLPHPQHPRNHLNRSSGGLPHPHARTHRQHPGPHAFPRQEGHRAPMSPRPRRPRRKVVKGGS